MRVEPVLAPYAAEGISEKACQIWHCLLRGGPDPDRCRSCQVGRPVAPELEGAARVGVLRIVRAPVSDRILWAFGKGAGAFRGEYNDGAF